MNAWQFVRFSKPPTTIRHISVFAASASVLVSLVSVALCQSTLDAKNDAPEPEITLRTDKTHYGLNDDIQFELSIMNKSKTPLYIYSYLGWGESASFSIWLKDVASGVDVSQDFIPDELTPPPTSKDAFIKLIPGHFYGTALTLKSSELGIKRGGTYEIVATYHSPIPSGFALGLPIWSHERGSVRSNSVTITVGK